MDYKGSVINGYPNEYAHPLLRLVDAIVQSPVELERYRLRPVRVNGHIRCSRLES